jgi:hypothetical protein
MFFKGDHMEKNYLCPSCVKDGEEKGSREFRMLKKSEVAEIYYCHNCYASFSKAYLENPKNHIFVTDGKIVYQENEVDNT